MAARCCDPVIFTSASLSFFSGFVPRPRDSGRSHAPGGLGGGVLFFFSGCARLSASYGVEVLMFPASGVWLEADGCRQRKGFGKQRESNRWKGAYASKSPQLANSPVTNCGKILASSRLGMDRRSRLRGRTL